MLTLAQANLKRGEELAPSGGISKEELDPSATVKVDEAAVEQALQAVYATRVGLGLPLQPTQGHDLGEVPAELDAEFLLRPPVPRPIISECGRVRLLASHWDATPKKIIEISTSRTPRATRQNLRSVGA